MLTAQRASGHTLVCRVTHSARDLDRPGCELYEGWGSSFQEIRGKAASPAPASPRSDRWC